MNRINVFASMAKLGRLRAVSAAGIVGSSTTTVAVASASAVAAAVAVTVAVAVALPPPPALLLLLTLAISPESCCGTTAEHTR